MGKTDKKSATKVAAAVVQPAKSAKKGKRETEQALEKLASAKKQKIDQAKVEAAQKKEEVKKQAEQKTLKKKKDETSSSEESDSSEVEKTVKQVTKKAQTVAKTALKESSSDDSSSDEEPAPKKQTIASSNVQAADDSDSSEVDSENDKGTNVPKKAESSNSDDSSDVDEDDVKQKSVPAKQVSKQVTVAKANGSVPASKKDESSDSSEEESTDSDNEKVSAQGNKVPIAASKGASKKDESSDESSDESDSDSEEETVPKKGLRKAAPVDAKIESSSEDNTDSSSDDDGADVKMVDASPVTAQKPAVPKHDKKAATPLSGATKTIFVGNLPYSAEKSDLETFFKDVGEVVDVRFSVAAEDGRPKGFGHVEFASAEQAQKAVELNGEFLNDRALKIDFARERDSHTPASKEGNYSSYRDGGSNFSGKVFVRGFDTSGGFDQIRTALEEQFSACGEVSNISIPKDFESGEPKGIAFVCFKDTDGLNKALELNGTDVSGYTLVVEEARPRDSDGPGSSRGRGRGRDGGRFSDRRGRGGDRGRGRGSFNRQGRGGDRGRGRGSFNRSNVGTGKKTTF